MNYKGLVEKKNDLITRAEEILNDAEANKRELTDAEAQELAEIRDDVRKIKDALKIHEEIAEEKQELKDEAGEAQTDADKAKAEAEKAEAETRAFDAYIRGVVNERANNLTPATGSGEAIIPTTIANKIVAKVYDVCPILERSSKYNVKGKFEIPYYDEDTTAITVAYSDEFTELSSNVGAFTTIELTDYLAGALTLISRKLINNSQFNVVDFVVERMAISVARFIEGELLNGTSGKVEGLSGATNVVNAGAATAITGDDLINVKDAVKDVFQNNAIWIMSTATRTALRKLKDEVGRYLLNDDISSPFGTTLLGKPVYVSDNMPNIAANTNVIYYGDMKGLATKFTEDMSIEVLREKYATMHAVGCVTWVDFDSKIEQQQAISVLKMAASDPTP
jgi:HK97 family phage major capsid protein